MTGRTTSHPNESQIAAAVMRAMQLKAWALVDAFVDQHKAAQFNGHVSYKASIDTVRDDATNDCSIVLDQGRIVSCVFHVGFVSIIETDAQICRLRGETVCAGNSPARSRLCRLLDKDFVRPIDGTAAKVAGGQDGR